MAAPQNKEKPTAPDSNRNTREETQSVILVFPYTRLFKRDTNPDPNKTENKTKDFTLVCRVRLSTVKKLGLEEYQKAPIIEDKEGNLRILRGSKGAKSWKFIFQDKESGKFNSYSFPVPAWCSIIDFFKGIYSKIDKKNEPYKVISPNGISYSVGLADKLEDKNTPPDVELKAELEE